MERVTVVTEPGGRLIAYGGTRTKVKLSRPWQMDLVVDPATCPFETKRDGEASYQIADEVWRVLPNHFTPYTYHKLIIPEACWPKEKVRTLGGTTQINAALTAAHRTIKNGENVAYELSVHSGYGAGQNEPHFHYHLLKPLCVAVSKNGDPIQDEVAESVLELDAQFQIFESENFVAKVHGIRAGQCFIAPKDPETYLGDEVVAHNLAVILNNVIRAYAERFRSVEGLPPDFSVGVKILEGRILYGCYIPVLNNWGFGSYGAIMGSKQMQPIIIPWPHEETVRHLRGAG